MMTVEEVIKNRHSGDMDQLDFIFSNEKNVFVTAPAGCGKTTAMVSKIARELSEGKIPVNKKILAMTFSVNAAMKIKDSLKSILPELVENGAYYLGKVDIANYHNFAMRILFKYGYSVNNEFTNFSAFTIANDTSAIARRYITSSDQNIMDSFENAIKCSDADMLRNLMSDYWRIMNEKLINNHIITYNGILVAAIKLLENENVSKFYQEYYKMILIDEFQDTNLLGYLLIQKLFGGNSFVFLGDDVQKIYGFMGAISNILGIVSQEYGLKEYTFKTNYRFKDNERMKQLDLLIRDYAENYRPSSLNAEILLKELSAEKAEDIFIVDGIERIIHNSRDKVAVLVRAGWQGNSIVSELDGRNIKYFNALYGEIDQEYTNFYKVLEEEYHNNVSGKALQRDLNKCLEALKERESDVYNDASRKFIFDSMFKLLQIQFEQVKSWDGTSKDKYDNLDFIIGNKGLKHMMEYIEERVVLTTIHASKGLEWDYVIIPKLNAHAFPPSKYVCKPCEADYSCNSEMKYC
ncbi:MAG: ATP-dependent helicase [Butyrivibrio sp.]|nr:ATP-dependent helicase [Butyrivibrio sp.]